MQRAGLRIDRRAWWVLALLAALLVRALVPAGFMPAVGAGSFALVFCEPGAMALGPHAHHHHPGPDGTGRGTHSASPECPFAQSAAPALPTLAAVAIAPPRIALVPAARRDDEVLTAAPLRYAAARGPPESC